MKKTIVIAFALGLFGLTPGFAKGVNNPLHPQDTAVNKQPLPDSGQKTVQDTTKSPKTDSGTNAEHPTGPVKQQPIDSSETGK